MSKARIVHRHPDLPDKLTGWSHCTMPGQAAYDAWAEVTAAIDAARLPFLIDLGRPGGGNGGEDQPGPRRLQLTPKQIEDGPILRGLCGAPFEQPEDDTDAR